MKKQASADFTRSFYDKDAGGIWNALIRFSLANTHEYAITTREEANFMVAEAQLLASKIVETYPPHFGIYFRDLTLSHSDK
uniref:Uncharacterized protein n=1 Tax=Panagrolaimus superbus TaxID=310955 RepID=A0A914YU89_9BILA